MGLFAPWALAGLLAVGLPVYIHLLRRHKSEPLRFSSLMFFEQRTQSSVRHRRLRYLLLFALRTALVVLLVLAFADPFVRKRAAATAGAQKLVVIAIDNSFSMRAGNRLEQARNEAASLLSSWRQGNQGQVLAFASSVQLLTQPVSDPAELRAAIRSVAPGDSQSSYAELARVLRSVAQSSKLPVEVHLFSDLQKSSMPASFADVELPAKAGMVLHAVGGAEPNWTVESGAAPHRVRESKAPVQVVIAGFQTPAARRAASLVVNGRVVETKTVDVPANGRAAVEFTPFDVPHGLSRCEVRIDSADSLRADDQFYFSVERGDPLPLLLVYDAQRPRSAMYFRAAIDASPQAAFHVEAVGAGQAANVALPKYAAVVLSDVAALPAPFEEALRGYVRAGGGLLIAAGPDAARRPKVPVFEAAVSGARYAAREGERFQTVSQVDTAHPALASVNRFENVRFYHTVRIEPGDARVLARLDDQTPLVLEKQVGEGRVLVFASTFDNISNDLPLHTAFVPFVEQAANYLAGQHAEPAAYPVDSFFEVRAARERGAAVEVLDPDGARPLSLAEAASAPSVQLARQGYYSIRRATGRQELVAVNADRRESDLATLAADEAALWQNSGQGSAPGGTAAEPSSFRLWSYLILGVVLLALAETWTGARYLQPVPGHQSGGVAGPNAGPVAAGEGS